LRSAIAAKLDGDNNIYVYAEQVWVTTGATQGLATRASTLSPGARAA
jgi:aspartate/methionine/tyrosine aminotransferase